MPFRPRHIFAASLTAAALFVPSAAQAQSACGAAATARPASVSVQSAEQATLCLLNIQRAMHHLRPLRANHRLDHAAVGHSKSMVNHKYFDHRDFGGPHPSLRLPRLHARREHRLGSLQYSTPASIVDMWMHSPGHRANILRSKFRDIGIGIANGAPEGGVHGAATYTTDFGKPA